MPESMLRLHSTSEYLLMNTFSPERLFQAAELVVRERVASISLLQRHLKLPYGEACQLMMELAGAGVVEEPNPAGRYHVALRRLEATVGKKPAAVAHARLLRDLAGYLVEQHGYENTACIEILAAPFKLAKPDLQAVVAKALAEKAADPIPTVMFALAELPQLAARFRPADIADDIRADAATAPKLEERHVAGIEARHQGMVYAMRYLLRRLMDDIDPHSRAVDHFIDRSFLPQGRAESVAIGHPEHVVPCAYIQRQARELLRYAIPVEEVASWVEPFVRVVWIEKAHADLLDGKSNCAIKCRRSGGSDATACTRGCTTFRSDSFRPLRGRAAAAACCVLHRNEPCPAQPPLARGRSASGREPAFSERNGTTASDWEPPLDAWSENDWFLRREDVRCTFHLGWMPGAMASTDGALHSQP